MEFNGTYLGELQAEDFEEFQFITPITTGSVGTKPPVFRCYWKTHNIYVYMKAALQDVAAFSDQAVIDQLKPFFKIHKMGTLRARVNLASSPALENPHRWIEEETGQNRGQVLVSQKYIRYYLFEYRHSTQEFTLMDVWRDVSIRKRQEILTSNELQELRRIVECRFLCGANDNNFRNILRIYTDNDSYLLSVDEMKIAPHTHWTIKGADLEQYVPQSYGEIGRHLKELHNITNQDDWLELVNKMHAEVSRLASADVGSELTTRFMKLFEC